MILEKEKIFLMKKKDIEYFKELSLILQDYYKIFSILDDQVLRDYFIAIFIRWFTTKQAWSLTVRKNNQNPLNDISISYSTANNIKNKLISEVAKGLKISIQKSRLLLNHLRFVLFEINRLNEWLLSTEKFYDNFEDIDSEIVGERLESIFTEIWNLRDWVWDFKSIKKLLDSLKEPVLDDQLIINHKKLLTENQAREIIKKSLIGARVSLELFWNNPASLCIWKVQGLYPHQYYKLKKILDAIEQNLDSNDPFLILWDIAPPSAWKTYMQAVLARILDLPFVFLTPLNSIVYWSDWAIETFKKVFHEDLIAVVEKWKWYDTFWRFMNYSQIIDFKEIQRLYSNHVNIPLLFFLDEWDVVQPERRMHALDSFKDIVWFPQIFAYSATTDLAWRSLFNRAKIVDVMYLKELIRQKKAKNIIWAYVEANIELNDENFILNKDWERVLQFDKIKKQEAQMLIDYPVKIYTQKHMWQSALIHCCSVKHANIVALELRNKWIRAECISGKTKFQQKILKQKYINWETDVLTSCDYLGRWFSDNGVTEVEIYDTFTQSKTKLYQAILRWTRLHKHKDVLMIYQILPLQSSKKSSFVPATLEDVLDLDEDQEINRILEKEICKNPEILIKRIQNLKPEDRYKFVWFLWMNLSDYDEIRFISKMRIRQIIDTIKSIDTKEKIDIDLIRDSFKEKWITSKEILLSKHKKYFTWNKFAGKYIMTIYSLLFWKSWNLNRNNLWEIADEIWLESKSREEKIMDIKEDMIYEWYVTSDSLMEVKKSEMREKRFAGLKIIEIYNFLTKKQQRDVNNEILKEIANILWLWNKSKFQKITEVKQEFSENWFTDREIFDNTNINDFSDLKIKWMWMRGLFLFLSWKKAKQIDRELISKIADLLWIRGEKSEKLDEIKRDLINHWFSIKELFANSKRDVLFWKTFWGMWLVKLYNFLTKKKLKSISPDTLWEIADIVWLESDRDRIIEGIKQDFINDWLFNTEILLKMKKRDFARKTFWWMWISALHNYLYWKWSFWVSNKILLEIALKIWLEKKSRSGLIRDIKSDLKKIWIETVNALLKMWGSDLREYEFANMKIQQVYRFLTWKKCPSYLTNELLSEIADKLWLEMEKHSEIVNRFKLGFADLWIFNRRDLLTYWVNNFDWKRICWVWILTVCELLIWESYDARYISIENLWKIADALWFEKESIGLFIQWIRKSFSDLWINTKSQFLNFWIINFNGKEFLWLSIRLIYKELTWKSCKTTYISTKELWEIADIIFLE